jgi:predicted lipid-binding transport protein (Tim44 family)
MKKNKKNKSDLRDRIVLIVLFAMLTGALALGLTFYSSAFGDYNDYDYDYDTGGSDWGDNDWGGSSWDSDDYDYGGGGGGDVLGLLSLVNLLPPKLRCCAIIIIIIVFIVVTSVKKSKRKRSQQNMTGGNPVRPNIPVQPQAPRRQAPLANLNIPNRDVEISNIIQARDVNFTAPDFIAFVKNVYMNIQDAWCKRDLEPVRMMLHQNLYERTEKQIQKKIADGIVQHLDRLTVNDAYMTSYRSDAQYEYVKVYLNSSMIDYQVKESTGQILYGDQTTRWTMRYEMTFMRSKAAKTAEAGAKEIGINCPNCGAPLKGTSFGKCPYCDSLVTTGLYNWVLSDFNAIKNEFHDEGIRVEEQQQQ